MYTDTKKQYNCLQALLLRRKINHFDNSKRYKIYPKEFHVYSTVTFLYESNRRISQNMKSTKVS